LKRKRNPEGEEEGLRQQLKIVETEKLELSNKIDGLESEVNEVRTRTLNLKADLLVNLFA
jgi:hypothetical protein